MAFSHHESHSCSIYSNIYCLFTAVWVKVKVGGAVNATTRGLSFAETTTTWCSATKHNVT